MTLTRRTSWTEREREREREREIEREREREKQVFRMAVERSESAVTDLRGSGAEWTAGLAGGVSSLSRCKTNKQLNKTIINK